MELGLETGMRLAGERCSRLCPVCSRPFPPGVQSAVAPANMRPPTASIPCLDPNHRAKFHELPGGGCTAYSRPALGADDACQVGASIGSLTHLTHSQNRSQIPLPLAADPSLKQQARPLCPSQSTCFFAPACLPRSERRSTPRDPLKGISDISRSSSDPRSFPLTHEPRLPIRPDEDWAPSTTHHRLRRSRCLHPRPQSSALSLTARDRDAVGCPRRSHVVNRAAVDESVVIRTSSAFLGS